MLCSSDGAVAVSSLRVRRAYLSFSLSLKPSRSNPSLPKSSSLPNPPNSVGWK